MSVIEDINFISVLNDYKFYIHFAFAIVFKKNLHMNVAKVDFYVIFAKIGIPATFASNYKIGLSTRWVLVIYPILAHTRVACNKGVSSGASFKCKKTSNYSTRRFEYIDLTNVNYDQVILDFQENYCSKMILVK